MALAVSAVALGGAFAGVQAVEQGALRPATAVQVGVVMLLVSAAAAAALTRSPTAQTRSIEIRTVYLAYAAVGFGLLSLAWARQQPGTAGRISQASVPLALLVAQVGVTTWGVGYLAVRSRVVASFAVWCRRTAAPDAAWELRFPLIAVALYVLGFSARIYRISEGSYAYLSDPRSLISDPSPITQLVALTQNLTLTAITVAAVDLVRNPKRPVRPRLVLASLVLVEVVASAYGGTKSSLVLIGLAVGVPFLATKRRLPAAAVAAAVLLLALSTGFVTSYRQEIVNQSSRLRGRPAADALIATTQRTLNPSNLLLTLSTGFESLGQRLRHIDNVAIITQRTPSEIPYRSPTELVTGPILSLVPRALWTAKPVQTTGLDFSREYYDVPHGLYTASAVTVTGDLYRHGGIGVLIAGMLLLGGACRYADRHWHPSLDLRYSVLYSGVLIQLTNLEIDAVSLVTGLAVALASSVLVTRWAFAPTGRSGLGR